MLGHCPGGKLVETGQCDAGKQATKGALDVEKALMIQLAPRPFVSCSIIDVLRPVFIYSENVMIYLDKA